MHLLRKEGREFRALHVDFGQAARELEWEAVRKTAARLGATAQQIKVHSGIAFTAAEIQGRNAALIFLALMHLSPAESLICIGIHSGTPFYDCSQSFFKDTARMVAEHTDSRVRLIAPLREYTKPQIVETARSIGLNFQLTHSCQRAVAGGCGSCHSCKDRKALAC
ncbi:7-cyano-7-deazaguanine synthase [Variovorax sp. LjRoot175]|uniref:7-cyano-7-deazaguanine synthase n=1 Tax=Variovorax sp. LjRoot175 TaxID=3342276 RepID=UPI003F515B73